MKRVRFILNTVAIFAVLGCTSTKKIEAPFNCELLNSPIKDFKIDIFGNLYTIDLKNRLKVYDTELNLLFEYYNNTLGEISYIDITNPKKIALFFNGFQKIVFVDDTLAELGRYEGDYNILAMGTSRDNNVWIYDGLDYRLKKISRNNQVLVESNPLESHHRLDVQPDYIIEYDNMVYLVEEGKGVVIFDNFGTYSSYFPADVSSVALDKKSMFYMKDGNIYQKVLDNAFAEERKLKTISGEVEIAYLSKNQVFFLEGQCLQKTALN